MVDSSEMFLGGMFSNSTVFFGGWMVAARRGLWDKDGESVGVGEEVPDVIFQSRFSGDYSI